MTVWSFKKQLELGEAAEARLRCIYHRPTEDYIGREHDFLDEAGNRIEVKSEMRTLDSTANFFIEYMRDIEKEKRGGPWQAMQAGSNHFVIFFVTDDTYFIFEDIPALCREILAWSKKTNAKLKIIRNRGWAASGWAVPREVLLPLGKEYKYDK
jgi:hypothetical protein